MLEQVDAITREIVDSILSPLDQDIPLSDNAMTVLQRRYLLRGPDGVPRGPAFRT